MEIVFAVLLPFFGTALGAACVFFMRRGLDARLERALTGFAAGVMVAASFTSLLLPAIRRSAWMGRWSFVPAVAGLWLGLGVMRLLDWALLRLRARQHGAKTEGSAARVRMMVLAVTLHNVPEGMAVGAVCAGCLAGAGGEMAALALSLGIAIQNFPEGAIVSMPLRAAGRRKGSAFVCGVLSGAVEPLGAALTLLAAERVVPALAYLLSFAAGAMLYVVLEELLPALASPRPERADVLFPALGLALMLTLDLLLG